MSNRAAQSSIIFSKIVLLISKYYFVIRGCYFFYSPDHRRARNVSKHARRQSDSSYVKLRKPKMHWNGTDWCPPKACEAYNIGKPQRLQ